MNKNSRFQICAAVLGSLLLGPSAFAQTNGSVSITATLGNLAVDSSAEHWTVVWVTKADGTFVRTIRRQGESYSSHWADHCSTWYNIVAATPAKYTVATDGFTGATATTYTAPNSPFTQTWNCKDANGATVPDGTYKIWIQYSENDDGAQGPVTTSGLTWTKGATASTVNPANQGTSFTNMSIKWTPGTVVTAPEIAVQQPVGSDLVDGTAKKSYGTVKIGKTKSKVFTIKNTGNASLTGLAITKNGTGKGDYTVTAPAAKTLAPGASTTFKVTFKPSAKGNRVAAIHIKSNDANENPFDIGLTGLGAK